MAVFATYTTRTDFEAVANAAARTRVGQSFTVTGDCLVTSIGLYLDKTGSPVDNTTVQLCSDTAGSPGSVLETGTAISNAGLPAPNPHTLVTSTFAGTTTLLLGTTYWVVLARSGAVDASNYPRTDLGNTSIPYARYKVFDGSVWNNGAAGYNVNFTVNGTAVAGAVPRHLASLGVGK